MKTCLGWDWKVSGKKLGTFLAKHDRSSGAGKFPGAPNEEIVQNHLTLALLNVF